MPSLLDLPDELLVQVIEDAVPTAMGSSKEYDERCRTLHAVALTSKRLHAVALPLLYRVLRVTEARFRPTLAACKGVDTPTYPLAKTLVCEGNAFGGLPADQLSFAVAATPGISDLRICYCKEFALIELQAMSGLASLTLHDVLHGTALTAQHASRDRNRLANAKGALEEMTASLSRAAQGAGPSLRLVLLESDLLREDDALADKEAFAELKPAVEAFLEACKAVGVEVIVQETSQYGLESFVSERFIQWCEQKYGTEQTEKATPTEKRQQSGGKAAAATVE
ncbi:hypothetical protein JCM10213v2_008354 [Rhodosporidiobolus nylandii]